MLQQSARRRPFLDALMIGGVGFSHRSLEWALTTTEGVVVVFLRSRRNYGISIKITIIKVGNYIVEPHHTRSAFLTLMHKHN